MKDTNTIYDVLILGSGPAGLAAALALGRARRSALIISHEEFRNGQANATHVLVHDGVDPNAYRDLARSQVLDKYTTIKYTTAEIVTAAPVKDDSAVNTAGWDTLYSLATNSGRSYHGRKVILATGCIDEFPDLPGYRENWPCNIYQGLFCDGWERTGHAAGIGVLALPAHPNYVHLAHRAFSFDPPRVVIFTNGPVGDDHPMKEALPLAHANGILVDERRITKLQALGGSSGIQVMFEDGSLDTLGFLINKPWTVPAGWDIAKQLGIESYSVDGFGTVLQRNEPTGTTSAPGVFACGDVANLGKGAPLSEAHGVVAADVIWAELVQEEALKGMAKSTQLKSLFKEECMEC